VERFSNRVHDQLGIVAERPAANLGELSKHEAINSLERRNKNKLKMNKGTSEKKNYLISTLMSYRH
jgi:hypothetical protein